MLAIAGPLVAILVLFFYSGTALAHNFGKSFVRVNGKYVTGGTNSKTSNDRAPETYMTNQTLTFKTDQAILNLPADTSLQWDWGDNTAPSNHADATHAYTKPGTHRATLTAHAPGSTYDVNLDVVEISVNGNQNTKTNIIIFSALAAAAVVTLLLIRRKHRT